MRNILYIITACICLTACEMETSDNGQLDGNWQLQTIDTLATGGVCDMSHSDIYWGVEGSLLQVRAIGNARILFRFEVRDNTLSISQPHQVITKDNLIELQDDSLLTPLGINGTQRTFDIESLNSKRLILNDNIIRLIFRRY